MKSSWSFVRSSTAQATYSDAGQRRIISKPASFNEVPRVSESRLCRRGHTSRAQHHSVHSFIWGWVLGEIFPIRVGSSRDILRMCNINSWWHISDGSMHGGWWRGTSHTDWTTQDNMCRVAASGDTATVVPLSKNVWAASAEWCRVWRVTTVARLPGHNHPHHHRTTLNKEGRRGPLKARSDSNSAWKDLRSVDGFLHPTLRHRHYRHHTAALLEFEPFYSAGDGDTFWKVDTLTFTFTASFHWDEIFDSKKGF